MEEDKQWQDINEKARDFAEAFLKKKGRNDLAKYFGADREVGISIDWSFFFSDFSCKDDSAAGLKVCLLAKKDSMQPMTEEQAIKYSSMAANGYRQMSENTEKVLSKCFWEKVHDIFTSDLLAHLSKESHKVAHVRDLMLSLYAAHKVP